MKTIIFACVHNAGRSQMAAALFNALADPSEARAVSAGTTPLATVSVRRSRFIGATPCIVPPPVIGAPETVPASRRVKVSVPETTPPLNEPENALMTEQLISRGRPERRRPSCGTLRRFRN